MSLRDDKKLTARKQVAGVNIGEDAAAEPGDCDCKTLRAKVEELVHGELCKTETASMRAHIEKCPDCADEEQALNKLTQAVKRACEEKAPESLREIIVAQLRGIHER